MEHKPICECFHGYTGDHCDVKIDYCTNNPCENGECSNSVEGFLCQCEPGYIGRRCHLRPCDYTPCHSNAECINLSVYAATHRSYRCVCPKGLKGSTCEQIKSPCHPSPCKNGECIPHALRSLITVNTTDEIDENVYEQYTCKCAPYFYGTQCDIFITPDFALEFEKPGTHNYVKLNGPMENLNQVNSNNQATYFRSP